jgi:Sulfotransferase family
MNFVGHTSAVSRDQVSGWAADRDDLAQNLDIRIFINGREHATCNANLDRHNLKKVLGEEASQAHSFNYVFAPPLTDRKTHHIEVVETTSGVLLSNGRQILHSVAQNTDRLMPILVTSKGRSGTTLLMDMFFHHPNVVVADAYPYEIMLSAYYASVTKVLASPKFLSNKNGPDFVMHAASALQIGQNPWNRPALHEKLGGAELVRLFEKSAPRQMTAMFRNLILEYYDVISAHQKKTSVEFFAEKCKLHRDSRYEIRQLLGEVREIIMIRDPRDFLCSAKVFWKFNNEHAFQEMRRIMPLYEEIYHRHEKDTIFVRYEDLILTPSETRRSIYDFVGLSAISDAVDNQTLFKRHGTSDSPAASIARWEKDLSQAEIDLCRQTFGSFMTTFGYTP